MALNRLRIWIFIFGLINSIALLFACNSRTTETLEINQWEEIQRKDTLTVLIENSASTYYWYQGEEMGFDFDLVSEFAKESGLGLKIKVMDNVDSMFSMLQRGEADMIASNLTYSGLRDSVVDFTAPIYLTRQVLVQRTRDSTDTAKPIIQDTIGLKSTWITVHQYSVFYDRLKQLEKNLDTTLNIHTAPGTYSTDDLIRLVSEGKIESTITDENLMGILSEDYPNIDFHLALSRPQPVCWVIRNRSSIFQKILNDWLSKESTIRLVGKLNKKYFKKIASTLPVKPKRQSFSLPNGNGEHISPYDAYFKEEAKAIGWDWRLMAALSFQESRFDSLAVSSHGAFGVMQLMPSSAAHYGCDTNDRVKGNIHAAALILQKLDERYSQKIKNKNERIKFILASYNAGAGHVLDAMQIARKLNQPDTIWDGSVENTILLKSQHEYYTMEGVKNGYCRCQEPYHFVYRVLGFYDHFKEKYKE